jgi:hypothetical protein
MDGKNGEDGTEAQLLAADPPTVVAAEKDDSGGSSLMYLSAAERAVVLSNPSWLPRRRESPTEEVSASGFVGGRKAGRGAASAAASKSR